MVRTSKTFLMAAASLVALATAGCGMGGMDMGGSSSGGSSHEMAAPTIRDVAKMAGALHVMWTNNTTGCDAIEGERKEANGSFTMAFSVPGDVDNKMDSAATVDQTYTYRVRCKMASDYTAYSNEMSQNPVR